MNNPIELFRMEVQENIENIRNDKRIQELSDEWISESIRLKYSYNFRWGGRPIIQLPQDIMAMQEIIWDVNPDLIVETGIAHGGSLIFYASMLKLLNIAMAETDRRIIGIDIDIREHNRQAIEKHPMSDIITMVQGSSIDDEIVSKVYEMAKPYKNVMVVFDSNHTGDHVLEECRKYEKLVTKGSYMVVMDTVTEMLFSKIEKENLDIPEHLIRPWNKDNNAMTGVRKFLQENARFKSDDDFDKLLITSNHKGYLKCVR